MKAKQNALLVGEIQEVDFLLCYLSQIQGLIAFKKQTGVDSQKSRFELRSSVPPGWMARE
jgi:hypothetical protein